MTTYYRFIVEYEDEDDPSVVHRARFTADNYEDAVILAKTTGVNQIIDRLEMVRIDL